MKFIFAFIIILVICWFIWRFSSTRYNLPCPTWLAWVVEMDNPFTKVNRAESIINHLAIEPTMSILDIGCGPGRLTIPLAEKLTDGKVVALDMQQGMLDRIKAKAIEKSLDNITYVNTKLEDEQLTENKYDRVLLVTVLGEIPTPKRAFKTIFRTLKPGGILSVTEIIFDPHFQRQKTVLLLATEVGLEQTAIFGNAIAYTMHLQKPPLEKPSS